MSEVDCLVVGAGPAGLTAATYLARFCRSVAIYDGYDVLDEKVAVYGPAEHRFDTLYPVLGFRMRSDLAVRLGARCTDRGDIIVDGHMVTSVPGLHAAGDVVSALNQVNVAVGHAAIAATHVHNQLQANFRN